jgi:ERCC4-type nuclease
MRNEVAADFPLDRLTILKDQQEKPGWSFPAPIRTVIDHFITGDYAPWGCEHFFRIERKSLPDLVQCSGNERERFEQGQVPRLLAFPVRILVIEASWADIESGQWRSKVTPNVVRNSLLTWQSMGLSVFMADNAERAAQYAARIMYAAARHQWRSARKLLGDVPQQQKLSPNAYDPATIDSFCPAGAESSE